MINQAEADSSYLLSRIVEVCGGETTLFCMWVGGKNKREIEKCKTANVKRGEKKKIFFASLF